MANGGGDLDVDADASELLHALRTTLINKRLLVKSHVYDRFLTNTKFFSCINGRSCPHVLVQHGLDHGCSNSREAMHEACGNRGS